MSIVGATTDTFILFENGVRRNRLVLFGLSNAADHMPSKPDPPAALGSRILECQPVPRWVHLPRSGGLRLTHLSFMIDGKRIDVSNTKRLVEDAVRRVLSTQCQAPF
jgi:hypothetical protein